MGDGEQWWNSQNLDTTDSADSTESTNSTDSSDSTESNNSTDTVETDADGDLLGESLEASIGTSDSQIDSDGDGFSDYADGTVSQPLRISFNPPCLTRRGWHWEYQCCGNLPQMTNGDYLTNR